jgi:hypothetical protein
MENETSPVTGQVEGLETADQFRAWLREQARKALMALVEEEVEALCGVRYHPALDAAHYRSGGVYSPVYVDGRPEKLHRPRVRRKTATGSEETALKSWQMAQDPAEWEEAMLSGRSLRGKHAQRPDGCAKRAARPFPCLHRE